jgi:flagellar motor switch protein FliN
VREMLGLDETDDLAMHLLVLAESLESVVTALNAEFATRLASRSGAPHLAFAGIREVDLGAGDTLGEVSTSVGLVQAMYKLNMGESPDIRRFSVYHIAPHEFFKALGAREAEPKRGPAVQDLDQSLIDEMLGAAAPRATRPATQPAARPGASRPAAPPRDPEPPMEAGPRQPASRRAPARGQTFGGLGLGDEYDDVSDDGPAVRPAQFGPLAGIEETRSPSNLDLLLDVNLRVSVELGRTTKSIRDILDLGPGSVLELDRLAGEPVDILVNDRPVARGEVVVVEDENFGVRVTDIISPAKRIQSLR